jgi:two-component system sensor kinase FixL
MQQPIYAMQNFMFAARQYLKKGQLDQVEQMLTKIERQVVRSREMSDRLRQLAIGSKHVRRASTVHQLIESCRDIVQMHADDARTLLLLDLQATVTSVMCDGAQIQQVILNLIRNSTDSLASTDSLDRLLVIETANDSHKIWIRVIDSGPGIQTVDEQRIFDHFFTTKETGLGIGLTFSRSVIAAHGGELTLHENRTGRVVFQIELPLSA